MIRRLARGSVLPACLAFVGPVAAQDGLALLEGFIEDTRTLRAEFEQQLIDAEGVVSQASAGTLWIARPNRFRWEYREPYEQLVLSDGERLWFYDGDLQQATVKPLGESLATTPAMLLSGEAGLADRFEVLATRQEAGLSWVDLRPREGDADFRQLSVGFADSQLRRMRLVDTLDQVTELRFHSLLRNPAVEDQLFEFQPPPGVDVIGELDPAAVRR